MAPARKSMPGNDLQMALYVVSWNALSILEDHWLPKIVNDLSGLKVNIVGLSETRRLSFGDISSLGYTYYCFCMSNGVHLKGVAINIPSQLKPFVTDVTLFEERIMRVKLKCTLCFMSLVALYHSTKKWNWFWYQYHKYLFPPEFCKIQRNENFRFLVQATRAAPLKYMYQCRRV